MNEERLQEIEARASMATGGPWESGRFDCLVEIPARGYSVCMTLSERNAAFIAHAREDVPALVAEVRRLEEARDAYQKYIADTCTVHNWTCLPCPAFGSGMCPDDEEHPEGGVYDANDCPAIIAEWAAQEAAKRGEDV